MEYLALLISYFVVFLFMYVVTNLIGWVMTRKDRRQFKDTFSDQQRMFDELLNQQNKILHEYEEKLKQKNGGGK